MNNLNNSSRREFFKVASLAALSLNTTSSGATEMSSSNTKDRIKKDSGGPYNILMIVTDQEQNMQNRELPKGFSLVGHERLAKDGVVFENHQIASCVCTPSRAVLYTGQHIQNNGMFDNAGFSWSASLSTEINTIGDLLREEGYYTVYKGKWHLTKEFETVNSLNAPEKILTKEMEAYGFSDYLGIGDIIAHTQGGYLHDNVITAMSKSWLRGKGEQLREEKKPWFMAVNLINPHDVMYYNTDTANQDQQSKKTIYRLNHEPKNKLYQKKWSIKLPESRHQAIDEVGRPKAHLEYRNSRGALVGVVPNEDDRWERLNNYYLNCIKDVDNNLVEILDELDELGITDNTIVIFTSDHGELGGAHGLNGKGTTAYKEQNNVSLIISHPAYDGGKRCKAVTSHVDIATTLISLSGGDYSTRKELPGKDISTLFRNPEKASLNALRDGALYNFNMFAFIDQEYLRNKNNFLASGGKKEDFAKQGYKPNLKKRGAIRSIFDGQYKFNRYFSPLEHHIPKTLDQLFKNNDLELYDLINDPNELNNLATNKDKNSDLIMKMNTKLNALIKNEVGEDIGQMLPTDNGESWILS